MLLKGYLLFFVWITALSAIEKPNVTCEFKGQLGNQMFQVATTIAYALDNNCIAVFPFIDQADYGSINREHVFSRINTSSFFPKYLTQHYYQDDAANKPEGYNQIPALTSWNNIVLHGYFQNEKYFAHHADKIRELFAPSPEILNYIYKKYGFILENHQTVAIHIRTFIPDFHNPNLQKIGTATWQYYLNALAYFPDDYTFLIFSDCPSWAKQNFPKTDKKLIFIEGESHYVDMYFMSLCQHQVVSAESTFSWWGAWLNTNPNKIVISPKQGRYCSSEESIPCNWIPLESQ